MSSPASLPEAPAAAGPESSRDSMADATGSFAPTATEAGQAAALPGPAKRRGLRLSIRIQVLMVLVTVSTLCVLVVSSTLLRYFNEDKATYIQDLNTDIASNTASSVSLLLQIYQDRLTRAADRFNESSEPAQALSEFLERNEDVVYLGIYDEERKNLLNLSREQTLAETGVDLKQFRAERQRLPESLGWIQMQGAVVRNSTNLKGLPTFSLTIPFVATAYGKSLAIRADFSSALLLRAIERTPGAVTYLVDRRGTVLMHPDPAVTAVAPSFAERKIVQAFVNGAGRSSAGTGEFPDDKGEHVLASFATVREGGLGVIVERPKKDAYLAADRLTSQSVRAALFILALTSIISVFVARALAAPLLQLSAAARRLEKGDFDVHVEPRAHDEFGDVARSFNLAASGLKERDTKLKEAYEQLLQSEKLAGFGKFSAGIAHEIKNPLMGIIGFAQILSRKLPEGDPKKQPLVMIEREAKRCKSILDNLLKFTRKEGLQLEPVRLHAHIRETLDLLAPQLTINQVKGSSRLEAEDDLIRADGNQLRQVFMNLTLNAVDAMEGLPVKRVEIATRSAGPEGIEVLITDTGSGIPEDKIRKIFDPFFTTKEPGKGTGLGLSVSYGIVTNHGGKISVRSKIGEGTEFKITLPTATDDVRNAERRMLAEGSGARRVPNLDSGPIPTAVPAPPEPVAVAREAV